MRKNTTKCPSTPLAQAATEIGITQVELAKRVGVDRGVIGRIWRGQQRPTRLQAGWIADALAIKVEELFPDGKFRDDPAEGAERLKTENERLKAENEQLEVQNKQLSADKECLETQFKDRLQEVVQEFTEVLTELDNERVELAQSLETRDEQLAQAREKEKSLVMQVFQARLQGGQRVADLVEQVEDLEGDVQFYKGLALAGGAATLATTTLAILARRRANRDALPE